MKFSRTACLAIPQSLGVVQQNDKVWSLQEQKKKQYRAYANFSCMLNAEQAQSSGAPKNGGQKQMTHPCSCETYSPPFSVLFPLCAFRSFCWTVSRSFCVTNISTSSLAAAAGRRYRCSAFVWCADRECRSGSRSADCQWLPYRVAADWDCEGCCY